MIGALWWSVALGFDPTAAINALKHDDGREGAFAQVMHLDGRAMASARRSQALIEAVGRVLDNPTLPIAHRILAARTLARLKAGAPVLARQLDRGQATAESTALAREVAVALRQLNTEEGSAALLGALSHRDPEVRAVASASALSPDAPAAEVEAVCERLLQDPWPVVRARAAEGLRAQRAGARCLVEALKDKQPKVQRAAAAGLVTLKAPESEAPLLKLAGDPRADVAARAEALSALGALNVLDPARQVLETHLERGGIEPLATGAARAAALSTAPASLDLLRLAVTSKTPSVALVAAQALTARKDLESLPLLQALHSRIDARRRPAVQRMLDELSPPTKVIEDLVDEDL